MSLRIVLIQGGLPRFKVPRGFPAVAITPSCAFTAPEVRKPRWVRVLWSGRCWEGLVGGKRSEAVLSVFERRSSALRDWFGADLVCLAIS